MIVSPTFSISIPSTWLVGFPCPSPRACPCLALLFVLLDPCAPCSPSIAATCCPQTGGSLSPHARLANMHALCIQREMSACLRHPIGGCEACSGAHHKPRPQASVHRGGIHVREAAGTAHRVTGLLRWCHCPRPPQHTSRHQPRCRCSPRSPQPVRRQCGPRHRLPLHPPR